VRYTHESLPVITNDASVSSAPSGLDSTTQVDCRLASQSSSCCLHDTSRPTDASSAASYGRTCCRLDVIMAPSYRSALEWNDTTLVSLASYLCLNRRTQLVSQVDSIITHGLAIAQPSLWWSHLSEVSGRALDGLRSSPEVNEDVPLVSCRYR